MYRGGGNGYVGAVIGIGRIVDRLEVGGRFRIQLSDADAIEPSTIVELETIDDRTLAVTTAHTRYELRRIDGAPPRVAPRVFASASENAESHFEMTGPIHFDVEPTARRGVFEAGAAVWIQKAGEERAEARSGVLLGDLDPGVSLRIATQGGVVATSAIDRVVQKASGAVEVVTSNSSYLLTLAEDDAE